jgi:D-3-phosphoglycerate dehydrogenase
MSAPRRVLWTDVPLESAAAALLQPQADVIVAATNDLTRIREADGIIAGSLLPADAALFGRASRLQVIARVGIGYDNIDLAAATAAGVCAVNTPEAPTESTAEFAVALMLSVMRHVTFADRALRSSGWHAGPGLQGVDLAGKTLGLVGCGRIGSRVAEIAAAFRMQVVAFDPGRSTLPRGVSRAGDLSTLLATADVVSLHVPLLPDTRHLIGGEALATMKKGSFLINVSRGPIVDEGALLVALTNGHLAGAGLDVWDPEPPAADNPLFRLPQVVATPHMAAMTREGRGRSHGAAASQVLQVWRGEQPAALLNPDVWARRRAAGKVS